jgi:hypothetical protein
MERIRPSGIATALDVSIESICITFDLLHGICPEVVQTLIDKSISPQVFGILRKMKPIRQIEAAEHSGSTNDEVEANP